MSTASRSLWAGSKVRAVFIWAAWILTFFILEGPAIFDKQKGDTLSEQTRDWFHVRTKGGAIAFGTVWIAFAGWFFWHILWQGK